MIPVIVAVGVAALVGGAIGASAEKNKLLDKPTYVVLITYADKNTVEPLKGTLIDVWGAATSLAATNKNIVRLELRAPDNTVMREWVRPST